MDKTLKGLNANALKYIAIIAMTIDHVGWTFIPFDSILGQVMHFIGRFTAPIMCYFIAEGFHYTHDVNKYLKRLGIFALICHPLFMAYAYYQTYGLTEFVFDIKILFCSTSIFFTLFCGLLALKVWYSNLKSPIRIILIVLICGISSFGDWMFIAVLWILFFGIFRNDFKKQTISYYIVALMSSLYIIIPKLIDGQPLTNFIWQLGLIFPPLIIALYNGKRGNNSKLNKWFFYIFYPAHLIIIALFSLIII